MKRSKMVVLVALTMVLMMSLTGCAFLDNLLGQVKGELIGQEFEINVYDNFANKTLTVTGSKVTVGLYENEANTNSESTGFKSEVLEVTINGDQMLQVGNTVLFEEKGLDIITDYEVPTEITANAGGGFVPLDRFINDVKNLVGKKKLIIVASQLGVPIGVYQGNSVLVEVPSDLPKMTRLNIDGKSLYISRANYVILDAGLLK